MKLVNLTPHSVIVNGVLSLITVPPSGTVARVDVEPDPTGNQMLIIDGVTIFVRGQRMGQVVGLPDPQDDTIYIVSLPVAQAVAGLRGDVVSPGPLIRDENGQPVACDGLVRTLA